MALAQAPQELVPSAVQRNRVHQPLRNLRGRIRFYVIVDGLCLTGSYVALCFWLGLALDYGVFKLFGLDWAQEMPRGFRATLLAGFLAGLLALVVMRILLRAYHRMADRSLALIIERHFPIELNDRLITAVELSDPVVAERYGYSAEMVEKTIRDAADRVEQLPVDQVFNWHRLRLRALHLVLGSIGVYVLVAAVYCLAARTDLHEYVVRFRSVASIWIERNFFLMDTPWPRRAYLELVGFPDSGDLRIGRNAPPPALRVRAVKWVVADASTPDGWRPLIGSDLETLGVGNLASFQGLPNRWRGEPVDFLEMELDRRDAGEPLDADTVLGLRSLFERLETLAASPRMARTVRQLTVPSNVLVSYRGETVRSEQKLQRQGESDFSGVLSELRETVRFTVQGEDFLTAPRTITVVAPPSLVELVRDEYRPAYLYHRLASGANAAELRGKRQEFLELPVSLGGSSSRIDVPIGSDVVLRARTDKPLRNPGGPRLRGDSAAAAGVSLKQVDDYAFVVECRGVAVPLDLTLEYTDTDGVIGFRPIAIRPLDDVGPEVDTLVEVIRKTRQGYLATPMARIPFSGRIRDDHGLDKVEYNFSVSALDSRPGMVVSPVVGLLHAGRAGLADQLASATLLALVERWVRTGGEGIEPVRKQPVASFQRRLQERADSEVPLGQLGQRLKTAVEGSLLRDLVLDPQEEAFDAEKLGLRVTDEKQVQPHYRLRLWMTAADNNVESGPMIGESKERYTFLLVSENELLAEIAKEEEGLHLKLEDTVNRLREVRSKLDQVLLELPRLKEEEFSPMARRLEEITEVVGKSWDISREVHGDYRRILKELLANRVQPGISSRVEKSICEPLEAIINQEFVRADEAGRAFYKALEAKRPDAEGGALARAQLEQLIDRLARVLDAMGDVTTINKLIALLVDVEKGQRMEFDRLKKLRDALQEKLLDDVLSPVTPPKDKDGKP